MADSSPIDIKIGGTPTTNNEKPKLESLWCNLPGNVLISIIERLCYIDQIYFLAVRKDWRSKIYGLVRHSDNFPWILTMSVEDAYSRKFVCNGNQCYLYDPIHKRKYTTENQILDGAHLHASKFGWLLLSTNIKSTYSFRFYSPFTNKVIELPALDMEISAGKIFTNVSATFSTAPTSSDCVIFVVSTEPLKKKVYGPLFFDEFCVSTCSPGGDNRWNNNVLLGTNGNKYDIWNTQIAYVNGVVYFTFNIVDSRLVMMVSFKPGLKEWKGYQFPRVACFVCMDCLIESEDDDENLLILYYGFQDQTWLVYQFNEAKKNWCKLENLGNRMLFVSPTSTSLQIARSAKEEEEEEEEEEEDGEGMGSFANTIHVPNGYLPEMGCSSLFYKIDKDQSFSQIYDWIDQEGFKFTWIQPPQMYF